MSAGATLFEPTGERPPGLGGRERDSERGKEDADRVDLALLLGEALVLLLVEQEECLARVGVERHGGLGEGWMRVE